MKTRRKKKYYIGKILKLTDKYSYEELCFFKWHTLENILNTFERRAKNANKIN